jgi:hypothetical protein
MSEKTPAQLPAPLLTLEQRLQRLGYVTVPHGPELCVRLPLLCSVRVRETQGRLRFIPKFGPLGRSGSLLLTICASTAVVGATVLAAGFGAATVIAAFAGIAALTVDACRFIVTEGCLTRLQTLADRGD